MLRSLPPDEFECHVALPGRSPLAEEFAAAGASLHTVPMERLSTSHGTGEWAGYGAAWPVKPATAPGLRLRYVGGGAGGRRRVCGKD